MDKRKPLHKASIQAYFDDLEATLARLEEEILSKCEQKNAKIDPHKLQENPYFQQLMQKITMIPETVSAISKEEYEEQDIPKTPEQMIPILGEDNGGSLRRKSNRKSESISRMFKNKMSLMPDSEIAFDLQNIFQREQSLIEFYIQQISVALIDSETDPSEGFMNIIYSCCSRSIHFSLLLYLATSFSPRLSASEIENQVRKVKCERIRSEIERVVQGKLSFHGNRIDNLEMRSLLTGTDRLDSYRPKGTREEEPPYPTTQDTLCSFHVGYTDKARFIPRQGKLLLSDKSIHFSSGYSKATLNKWIDQIQDLRISDNPLVHSFTLIFSDMSSHHFFTGSLQDVHRVSRVITRLVCFDNPHHPFVSQQTPSSVKIEERLFCISSLKYSREYFGIHRKDVKSSGSYAIFKNDLGEKFESGDGVMLPYSLLGSLIFANTSIPLYLNISNPHKNGKSIYATVFNFYAPKGQAILPEWMMDYLKLTSGDSVHITVVEPDNFLIKEVELEIETSEVGNVESVHLGNIKTLTSGTTIPVLYKGFRHNGNVISCFPPHSFVFGPSTIVNKFEKIKINCNKILEFNQAPLKEKLQGSKYNYYSIPILTNVERFYLEIESNMKVEIFVSTVKMLPDLVSCEW